MRPKRNDIIKKNRPLYCIILTYIILILTILACQNTEKIPVHWKSYQKSLDTLKSRVQQIISTSKKSERVNHSQQILIGKELEKNRDLFESLPMLADRRLPKLKERRLSPIPPLQIPISQFLSLQGCKISYLIGFRNSQLGRVMTYSQRLIYNAEFLYHAPLCQLEGSLSLDLKQVWISKFTHWSHYVWNATWLSKELSLFFSQSWPRDRRPAQLDAHHESRLLWLANIFKWNQNLAIASQQDAILQDLHFISDEQLQDLKTNLEVNLKFLPPYVGGQIMRHSYMSYQTLYKVVQRLLQIMTLWMTHSFDRHSEYQQICHAWKDIWGKDLASFVRDMATYTQPLNRLVSMIKPLIPQESSIPPKMSHYLGTYLSYRKHSLVDQIKILNQMHVALWKQIQAICTIY